MGPKAAKRYKRYREETLIYGGDLLKTRLGRSIPRPLSIERTMHFVMRSTQAKGNRSLRERSNLLKVEAILRSFAEKHGVRLFNFAVQTNHLHLYLQLSSVKGYFRFIRAITSAIAYAVARGVKKFWDRRPFSRIVRDDKEDVVLNDYVELNKLEANGFSREKARKVLAKRNAEISRNLLAKLLCGS
jgi:REP element-mobilizing transposase RayT